MRKKRGEKPEIQKQKKEIISVLLRYITLIIFGIFLSLFYKIFFVLTIWPSFFLLNIFYNASVVGNLILINGLTIEIISACVAGSAYYLLLILNLTTRIKIKKRVYSLIFSFSSLLLLNILRIFFLSVLFVRRFAFFDITHKLLWYVLSIIFVIGIWFLTSWIFKIKEIPIYSDIKRIVNSF